MQCNTLLTLTANQHARLNDVGLHKFGPHLSTYVTRLTLVHLVSTMQD